MTTKVNKSVSLYMSAIGRRGGSVKSDKKSISCRINGAKRKSKKPVDEAKPLG